MQIANVSVPRAPKEIKLTPKQERNFWKKVDKSGGDDACWLWTASKNKCGYGNLGIKDQSLLAHRVAYVLANDQIPHLVGSGRHGTCVCHRCDVPACCNPAHLFLGTQVDNVRDREIKGRNKPMQGAANGNSKLTLAQVVEVRALYAAGGVTQPAIAARFGVSKSAIHRIINRRKWTHV